MKVLIVEDSEQDIEVISRFLSRFGIEVECTPALREAYLKDAQADWDAIILDGHLSDANPFESSWFANVARGKVFLITGNPDAIDRKLLHRDTRVFDKSNMQGIIQAVLDFLRKTDGS